MKSLVIVEHDHATLSPSTLRTLTAAQAIGGGVDLLVAGEDCRALAEQAAALPGVARVRLAEAPHYRTQTAENLAPLIAAQAGGYSHLIAPASTFGKDLMPRVAALLDVEPVVNVQQIVAADTFVRPIHAGNILETVRCDERIKVLTIRTTAFAAAVGGGSAPVERLVPLPDSGLAQVLRREMQDGRSRPLESARTVVAGGRGLGSAQAFRTVLAPLADALDAALGASYGAVGAGYAASDLQIGQTGKIVAPELYVAVGISGAIQHLAGIKDAKIIVAINRDPEAPICKQADYVLVADLFDAVPALLRALRA